MLVLRVLLCLALVAVLAPQQTEAWGRFRLRLVRIAFRYVSITRKVYLRITALADLKQIYSATTACGHTGSYDQTLYYGQLFWYRLIILYILLSNVLLPTLRPVPIYGENLTHLKVTAKQSLYCK